MHVKVAKANRVCLYLYMFSCYNVFCLSPKHLIIINPPSLYCVLFSDKLSVINVKTLYVHSIDTYLYFVVSSEENSLGNIVVLTIEKVLEIIESSYPNPITIKDVAK